MKTLEGYKILLSKNTFITDELANRLYTIQTSLSGSQLSQEEQNNILNDILNSSKILLTTIPTIE
jgi:hypothetical protein